MASKVLELKIDTPSAFDGNTIDAAQWMYSVISYFELNDYVYHSDKKKIIATLSFMNKGTATPWVSPGCASTTKMMTGKLQPSFSLMRRLFPNMTPPMPSPNDTFSDILNSTPKHALPRN
ncbi:hypothetical protein BS17DRAFT_704874 [Gyrodon lividus]|nr:hypothetical protein BS17DRAFT_704874 [Gyrodon lividus]